MYLSLSPFLKQTNMYKQDVVAVASLSCYCLSSIDMVSCMIVITRTVLERHFGDRIEPIEYVCIQWSGNLHPRVR